MKLIETLFNSGKLIGQLIEDTNASRVKFEPIEGGEHLTRRRWKSRSACRKEVKSYYR